MDVIEAIRMRKSIRGYKPDPVPKEVLKDVLEAAVRAPSAMNTQPWEITVIGGEVLENIKRQNTENLTSGVIPNPEGGGRLFEGVYRQRQVNLAKQIFQLMGIAREDTEKRGEWMQRGFRFFDAPAAFIISADRSLHEPIAYFDVGSLCQTICLCAVKHGLGTCIEDQGTMYPDVVRKYTGLPESNRIIIGIAVGYPEWDFPANKLESHREPLEVNTTWCGF